MSSADKDNLTSFFPIGILFVSFSCLIPVAKNSSLILNKSGESGCSCLVPNLRGNVLIFPHLVPIVGYKFAMCILYYVEYVPSIPSFFRAFIMKEC
jgi:hypothetical protein